MADDVRSIRRGLPRHPGGDPWPPETVVADAAAGDLSVGAPTARATSLPARPEDLAPAQGSGARAQETGAREAGGGVESEGLRRGLPRVAGGEPWPSAAASAARSLPAPPADELASVAVGERAESPSALPNNAALRQDDGAVEDAAASGRRDAAEGVALRRGLPRVSGGDSWPPQGTAVSPAAPAPPAPAAPASVASPAVSPDAPAAPQPAPTSPATAASTSPAEATPASDAPRSSDRAPLTVPRTVWPGRAAYHRPPARPEPVRLGPFTRGQWMGAVVVGGVGLLAAAFLAVTFVRALLSMPFMQDFLAAYPGEYHLPDGAPVGIPAWLGWQHFFNVFLMVLIIRSGLQVRREKRPSVFWTPRRNKKGKISLALWFHQGLDILWLVNGAVFVILLFATGQWMRIVPTSWEVFPNALSAVLQYVSLDWPTENGWVNYNSLQQLAYFSTVFIAAPLAAITGYRMSGMWPKKAARLNAAYPVEWARRLHFPVMLYFVVFIFIHVALVLATGALRNLNHMYAAQGSVDGVAYADNWTGFWMFFASLVVIAAAWVAARPLVLAPVAKLFGTVTSR